MSGAPWWRRAFDAVEGPLGDALTQGARTDVFNDAVAVGMRLERWVQAEVERRTRRALHVANLPAATDVRRLAQQVAELQRQVRALSHAVEQQAREGGGQPSPPSSPPRRSATDGDSSRRAARR